MKTSEGMKARERELEIKCERAWILRRKKHNG
jgi:hypothetical protein